MYFPILFHFPLSQSFNRRALLLVIYFMFSLNKDAFTGVFLAMFYVFFVLKYK